MATKFISDGTDSTQDFSFFTSTTGTVSSSTTQAHTGPRAIKVDSGAGASATANKTAILTTSGRLSLWFYWVGLPTLFVYLSSSGTTGGNAYQLRYSSATGKVQIYSNGTQLGVDGTTTLTANTWHRISFAYSITSTTVHSEKLWLDGNLEVNNVNQGTLANANPADIQIGYTNNPGGGKVAYVDDIYIDDSNALTDPGDIRVTDKLAATENTTNFDTAIGTARSTSDYNNVNERPINEANGWRHNATSDVQENYGLQSASVGDADISGATLIARLAWVWAKRGNSDNRFVQAFKNTSKTAGTTLAITVSGATVGNTYLIAFCMDGALGILSATDDAATPNTYTVDVDKANTVPTSSDVRTAIIRAYLANVTSLTTVTITLPSVTAKAAVVAEFVGIIQASPLDQSTSNVGASTAASSGATATTSQADEIVFGAVGAEEEAGTFTTGTGMTPAQSRADMATTTGGGAASNVAVEAQYAIQTATAAQTANATITNTDWAACVATYKAASGGGSLGTPKMMDNGTETALALTTVSSLFSLLTDSASYPSNAAGIGMRSSAATPDTFFYECGVLLAYIPGTAAADEIGAQTLRLGWHQQYGAGRVNRA